MNELQIFKSQEFGQVRTVTIDGEPWFVAKDVADALGYSNSRDALARHVDDEDKTSVVIPDTGSNYKSKATLINESGLYSLVLLYGLPGVWYRAEDVLALCEFKEPKHSDEEWEALLDECIRLKNEISELRRRLENVQIAACGGESK